MALRHCRDIEDLETALNELPESLDATYDRILDNIRGEKDRKRAKSVLRLIAVAYRPLTIDEVNEALTVDCDKENINPKRRIRDPFGILEICSGLIELSKYVYS
jgi:ankyrin repeat domain-containing protein 50